MLKYYQPMAHKLKNNLSCITPRSCILIAFSVKYKVLNLGPVLSNLTVVSVLAWIDWVSLVLKYYKQIDDKYVESEPLDSVVYKVAIDSLICFDNTNLTN